MLRKLISVLLVAVLLVFSFAACAKTEEEKRKEMQKKIRDMEDDLYDDYTVPNNPLSGTSDNRTSTNKDPEPNYTNVQFGFGFKFTNGWHYLTKSKNESEFNDVINNFYLLH